MDEQDQHVILAFGDYRIEVALEAWGPQGGVDALAQEAASAFDLEPGSFGLYDGSGMLGTDAALKRALGATTGSPCVIEARERPEWKRIRAMDAQIQALEQRLLAKVDGSLAGLTARVDCGIAPLLGCLAAEQIDTRAEIEALKESLGQAHMKVNQTVAPLLGSLATEQIDTRAEIELLKERLEQTDVKMSTVVAPLLKDLATEQIDTRASIDSLQESLMQADAMINTIVAPLLRNVTTEQIGMKCNIDILTETLSRSDAMVTKTVAPLLESISLEQVSTRASADDVSNNSPAALEAVRASLQLLRDHFQVLETEVHCLRSPSTTEDRFHLKHVDEGLKSKATWQIAPNFDILPEIAYSKKSRPGAQGHGAPTWNAATAPFAQIGNSRQLDRALAASRSLPLLPRVTCGPT
jgi:hypothetical protein